MINPIIGRPLQEGLRNFDEKNSIIESRDAVSRLYQDFVLGL